MHKKLFLSYRRADNADITGRIAEHLKRTFGEEAVFRDVHSIPLGEDFREHLRKAVGECHALLVVIGSQWLDVRDARGNRRFDAPEDWVRIEIEAGLARQGLPVIPLLVGGASPPPRACPKAWARSPTAMSSPFGRTRTSSMTWPAW